MGKAKPTKHTAAEIKAKIKASTGNMGGGQAGLEDRKGGKAGHARFQCHICKTPAPSIKSMQDHHEAKHPGVLWEPEKCSDVHQEFGGTTQGVAVRGSVKREFK